MWVRKLGAAYITRAPLIPVNMVKVKVAQLCPTLCEPMDSTAHGILQARILEWVAFPFSRESSWPRNRTGVSCIAGGFFTNWAISEVLNSYVKTLIIYLCQSVYMLKITIYADTSLIPVQRHRTHSSLSLSVTLLPQWETPSSSSAMYLFICWTLSSVQ